MITVNQGLADLLDAHIEAAMARYETIQDMTRPVLACTERILALGEGYPVEVLSAVLTVYRRYIGPLKTLAAAEIGPAIQALNRQPTNLSLLDALMKALGAWLSLSRPLILLDTYYGRVEQEFEVPFQRVRDIVAELSAHRQYDLALRIARLTNEVFGTDPSGARPPPVIEELREDIRVIEGLSVQVKIAPFQKLIAQLERDPAPLVAALQDKWVWADIDGTGKDIVDGLPASACGDPGDEGCRALAGDTEPRDAPQPQSEGPGRRLGTARRSDQARRASICSA